MDLPCYKAHCHRISRVANGFTINQHMDKNIRSLDRAVWRTMRCKPASPVLRWRVWPLWRAFPKQLPSWGVAVNVTRCQCQCNCVYEHQCIRSAWKSDEKVRLLCNAGAEARYLIQTPTLTLFPRLCGHIRNLEHYKPLFQQCYNDMIPDHQEGSL
jgi:hypothetical protein